jgi:hypothetical protein
VSIDPIGPQAPTRPIYPTLAERLTPTDLHRLFSPNYEERRWAPTIARTPSSQVALLVQLKIFQAVGRFLPVEQIPEAAIEYIARALGVDEEIRLLYTDSTLYRHHRSVLERLQVTAWGAAGACCAGAVSERAAAGGARAACAVQPAVNGRMSPDFIDR